MAGRYKPVGWRNEPHRHSLAARGISTRRPVYFSDKYSRFGSYYKNKRKTTIQRENDIEAYFEQDTGVSQIDVPDNADDVIETRMSPDEFMRFVYEMQTQRSGTALTFDEFKDLEIEAFRTEQLMRDVENGQRMKTPYIEFEDGQPKAAQGLHRAAVAQELGLSEIPVVMYEDEQEFFARQVYAKVSGPDGETVDKMSNSQFRELQKAVSKGQADGITNIEKTRPPIQEFVHDELREKSPEVARAQMASIKELREEGKFPETQMSHAYEQEIKRKAQEGDQQ